MIEGGGSNYTETKTTETKSTDNTETKSSAPEKLYQELAKVATKLNDMLFSEDNGGKQNENEETKHEHDGKQDNQEASNDNSERDTMEKNSDVTSELLSRSISELMDRLFSDDKGEKSESNENTSEEEKNNSETDNSCGTETNSQKQDAGKEDNNESIDADVEKKDPILEQIEKTLGTPEGIKALIERHPEKAELWKSQLEALETLNDPEATPAEIRSAQAKLSILKGQLLEIAVKDALTDAGFDVESQQRVVEGESGGTRPDVIAKNNTDHPIEVFGVTIQPGETVSVECKCGGSAYMTNQLNNHIPNQLSGQEGTKILLTTSDIKDTPSGLAKNVCDKYGAKLVIADVSVTDVENAIKEVAES